MCNTPLFYGVAVLQSHHGSSLLATVSNVHPSQSGTLVLFLLSVMLTQPHFLHVLPAVSRVLWHRLTQLLHQQQTATLHQQQLSLQQLQPYMQGSWLFTLKIYVLVFFIIFFFSDNIFFSCINASLDWDQHNRKYNNTNYCA